jgi:phosphatidylglycerophosphate synthase
MGDRIEFGLAERRKAEGAGHLRTAAWIVVQALSALRGAIGVLCATALRPDAAIAMCVVATVSDFADGFLARAWRVRTVAGAALDLAADGLFFGGCLVLFWRSSLVPSWLLAAIAAAVLPELLAQAVLWKAGRPGSPHRFWNRAVGGYSYLAVFLILLDISPLEVAVVYAVVAWLANLLDLLFAVGLNQPITEHHAKSL